MTFGFSRSLLAALAVCLVLGSPLGVRAQSGATVLSEIETTLVDVIERSERSVVSITRFDGPADLTAGGAARNRPPQPQIFVQGQRVLPGGLGGLQQLPEVAPLASGAGVVIDPAGLVLTQFRVIGLGDTHVVTDIDGQRYQATVRAADSRSGLAVLAIAERLTPVAGAEEREGAFDLPALPIGRAELLRKGRIVVAIGNPFAIDTDGQPTASWGSVTNTALKVPQNENLNGVRSPADGTYRTTLHHFGSIIQTDARLGWNANGGALLTLDGELVGITTTASTIAGHEQPAGYAIPLNEAMRRAIDTLRKGLEPEYGLLGVSFNRGTTRSQATGRVGIGVSDAYRGGPAQIAGLRAGDLLLSVAGKPLRTPEALQLVVSSLPPGDSAKVRFERGGKVQEASVKLGKAYVEEGQIVTRRRASWRGLRVDFATAVPPEVLREKSQKGHLDEEGCVVVSEVDAGSVSWESGVRPYSYISHVSGRRVTSPEEFYAAVKDAQDNVKLKFTKPLPPRPETVQNPNDTD